MKIQFTDLSDADLERAITGALRQTLDAHGPITREWLSSASKRVLSAIKNQAASIKRDRRVALDQPHEP